MLAIGLSALCTASLPAQVRTHDLPPAFRSLAGVTLNRDSAATIRAKLGSTREQRVGSGHDVFTAWCYVGTGPSSHTLVELMSDASDMGTPGRELNVIRLRSDAPAKDREGCAPLPASDALSTPAGLRLGLDSAKMLSLFGPRTRRGADSLIYEFSAKEYLTPGTSEYETWNTLEYRESCFDAGPPYANVSATVIALLRDGRAVEIRIERYDQSVC
jgi:hypothetical protein